MDGRCDHCPVPPEVGCHCATSGARRGCAKVDPGSPDYDPRYIPILVRWSTAGPDGAGVVPGGGPDSSPGCDGCGSPPAAAFPPLMRQARNLAGAVVRSIASGLSRVTPEERARRLAICHECPHFSGGKCTICGCVARWKARLASESCPIQKW